jgi:hypothetical protein
MAVLFREAFNYRYDGFGFPKIQRLTKILRIHGRPHPFFRVVGSWAA